MDSSSNQSWSPEDVLAHCSHQAKRIKKLTRSTNAFARHTKTQGDKVKVIANDAAHAISFDFSTCQIEKNQTNTGGIHSKLEELFSNSRQETQSSNAECGCSSSNGLRKENGSVEGRLPTLPSNLISIVIDDVGTDDVSDSGSDFFPDWSSVDSCASSICSISEWAYTRFDVMAAEDIFLNDESVLKTHENDVEIETDDEEQQEILRAKNEIDSLRDLFNKGECTMMLGILQPAPAAGKDDPIKAAASNLPVPDKIASSLPGETLTMAPSALRRVKSMVMENDLQDGVEIGKRMFASQQKQILASMTAHPSPLLASDDIVHVKKSPSQTSAKYSLKRSRSNISAELSTAKRNNATWYTGKEPGIEEEHHPDVDVQMEEVIEEGFLP